MYTLSESECRSLDIATRREWILTNGLGGFASGTASGINTRRYHGLLVAAIHPPADRMVVLAAMDAFVKSGEESYGVSSNQYPGTIFPEGFQYLRFFSANDQVVSRHDVKGMVVERRVRLLQGENTVEIEYVNVGEKAFELSLRPLVCHKPYHQNFREQAGYPQHQDFQTDKTSVDHNGINLTLSHVGARREPIQGWYFRFEHAREEERGLDPRDDLFCPCELSYRLLPGESATVIANVENSGARTSKAALTGANVSAPQSERSHSDVSETLVSDGAAELLKQAAKKFLVETDKRATIIAGYPWFTDWGRDTMIALPGICLHTGNIEIAKRILRDYATQTFQGLIPNRFAEAGETPDYNTVDGTLWYANAIYKTLQAEWDEEFAREMFEVLKQIYTWHKSGTLFGIRMDPADGLLTQGERGLQLTWMDAKIGDWVVTPRHGKPVEINGLWINMLRILEWLATELKHDAKEFSDAASRAELCFDLRFFHEHRGFYADTIDPLDVSLRPNQVIPMALPFGPAKGDKAKRALDVVTKELLTPKGLRTLGPNENGYCSRYEGPLPKMDSAYHQGTAWPWLLGSYATALVKVNDDKEGARQALGSAIEMLSEYGIGGIAEVYDANAPQRPNGCPWQAWSVGEILRAMIEIEKAPGTEPGA